MPAPALQALLTGVIDYAGLFPPAKLPLEPAWQNFRKYQQSPLAWMLGRFVCPADKLSELPTDGTPVEATDISVLGPARFSLADWTASWRDVQSAVTQFAAARTSRLDMFELRLPIPEQLSIPAAPPSGEIHQSFVLGTVPPDVLEGVAKVMRRLEGRLDAGDKEELRRLSGGQPLPAMAEGIDAYLAVVRLTDAVLGEIAAGATAQSTTFLEAPLIGDWFCNVGLVANAIGQYQRTPAAALCPVGLKLRTGGLEAAAFPSVEQIAWVIVACRDAGVFWKATAGLHHPIRHFNSGVGAKMHGFINVLAADVLAHVHGLKVSEVTEIVAEENASTFHFGDQLTWRSPTREYSASAAQIAEVRAKSLQSFGSCSFDEPVEDLRALCWLERG